VQAPLRFRRACADDVPALAVLYRDAVLALAPQACTQEQVEAWAGFGADTPAFREFVLGAHTWIAEAGGEPVGFCGIDDTGEVRSLYVRAGMTRRGIGTALLAHAIDDATVLRRISVFRAWASVFSRPVFERQRFRLVDVVESVHAGVVFERARVERR
jgi:putative acetyltransferase